MEEYLVTRAAFEALQRKHPTVIPKGFGFECGRGWIDILDRFFSEVERVLPLEAEFRPKQIKEKLAGLRIYYALEPRVPDEIDQAIRRLADLAEARSFHACESCGRPGRVWSRSGFYLTACDLHAKERSEGYADKAVPLEANGPHMVNLGNGWLRYDEAMDDLVPSEPPEGWCQR